MRTRIPLVAFRTTRIPLRYDAAQPDARERARAADLIVLPDGVAGTNCGNCLHFRDDYCTQPDVLMPVTKRECCIYWDAPGTVRVADLPPGAQTHYEGGHWVTIGAQPGGDGKMEGGTHVFVKGGHIAKGPPRLIGDNPAHPEPGPESTPAPGAESGHDTPNAPDPPLPPTEPPQSTPQIEEPPKAPPKVGVDFLRDNGIKVHNEGGVKPDRAAMIIDRVASIVGSMADWERAALRGRNINELVYLDLRPGNVVLTHTGSRARAFFSTGWDGRRLVVATSLADRKEVRPVFGQHLVGGNLQSILRHELGHAVQEAVFHRAHLGGESSWGTLYKSKPKEYWARTVSKYAATQPTELFAEAYAAWKHPGYASSRGLPPELVKYFTAAGVPQAKPETPPEPTRNARYADCQDQFGRPLLYAAAHAPKGGVTVGGKKFIGGQFIPAEVMADASPEERAAVESGETRPKPLPPPGGAKLKETSIPPRDEHGRRFASGGSIRTGYGPIQISFDSELVSPDVVEKAGKWLAALPPDQLRKSAARRIEIFENPEDMYARLEEVGIDPGIEADGQVRGAFDFNSGTLFASTWNGEEDSARTLYHELGHSILGMDEDAAEGWAQQFLPREPSARQPQIDPNPSQPTSPQPRSIIPPTPVHFDSPAAFAGSLAAAYAAGGHDPAIAQRVAAALPPNVLTRLSGGRLRSVTIHPTVEAVTDSFYTGDPQLRSIPRTRRQRSLGFYDTATCTLETDGGPDPVGTLAHEIGHAIDNEVDDQGGGAGSLSESAEFVAVWTKEIKATGNLTAYAATEPAEGFAEFARYLYSGNPAARAEAEMEFPGVFAFFKKYGLVDGGAVYSAQDRFGRPLFYVTDAAGHEHKGKGPGGGQFTGTGNSGGKGEESFDKLPSGNDASDAGHGSEEAKVKTRIEVAQEIATLAEGDGFSGKVFTKPDGTVRVYLKKDTGGKRGWIDAGTVNVKRDGTVEIEGEDKAKHEFRYHHDKQLFDKIKGLSAAPEEKKDSVELWQVPLESYIGSRIAPSGTGSFMPQDEQLDRYRQEHKRHVEQALRSGKAVPANVLADYPELKS